MTEMNKAQIERMNAGFQTMGEAMAALGESVQWTMARFQLTGALMKQTAVEEDIARTRMIYPLVRGEKMPRFWRRHQGRVRQQAKAEVRKSYRHVVELRREGKGSW